MSQFKILLTSLLLVSLVACTPEIPEESKTSVQEDPIGKCLADYGDKDLCLEQMKLQIEAKQAEIELQKLEEKSNSDAGLTATEALLLGTLLGQMTSNPYSSYNPSSSYYSPTKYKSVSKYHSVSSSPTYKPPVATPVTNVKSTTPVTSVTTASSVPVAPVKTNSVPSSTDKNTNVYGSVVTPVQSTTSVTPVAPKTNVVPVTSVNKTESSVKAVTPTNTQTTNISKSTVPVTKPSTEKSSWFSKSSSSSSSYSKSSSIRSGRR